MTPELRELVEKWNEKNGNERKADDLAALKRSGEIVGRVISSDNELTECYSTELHDSITFESCDVLIVPTEREVMEELKKKCGDDFEVTPHEGGWLAYYDPDLREPIKDATDPDLLTCLLKLWAEVVK